MIDTSVNLNHPDAKGTSPAFAVTGAIIVSLALVTFTHYVFNSSAVAVNARNISLQHYAQRKARNNNPNVVVDPNLVTTDSLNTSANDIDQTIRSVDQGSSQLTADDLSDKALGLQ